MAGDSARRAGDGAYQLNRGGYAVIVFSLCFAAGIGIGQYFINLTTWVAVASAAAGLLAALIGRRSDHVRWVGLGIAAASLGWGWLAVRTDRVHEGELAAMVSDEPELIRVRGTLSASPEVRRQSPGSMGRFDFRPAGTFFPLNVDTIVDSKGNSRPIDGNLWVRVSGLTLPMSRGDRVEVSGYVALPAPAHNPGEFDRRAYARSLDQAGVLTVSDRGLVIPVDDENAETHRAGLIAHCWSQFTDFRDNVRRRCTGWLLADLPLDADASRNALLAALLLGQRDPTLDEIDQSFKRLGLAHLLAISGLHLGLLIGFVMLIAQLIAPQRRWHGLLLIAVVLLYLFIIEVRMPVLRAGVMTIAGALGLVSGRRLRVGSLIAFAGLLLLLWKPDQLFTPGFQLSFGVVLGIIYLSPRVRRRWFGEVQRQAATTGRMLAEWLKTSSAVAVVAWLVATPIVMCHFGIFSLFAAPLSLLALPIVAAVLLLGYIKLIAALLLPSFALFVGAPLAIMADLLVTLVAAVDTLPGSSFELPYPPVFWSISAIAIVVAWSFRGMRRHRVLLPAAAAIMAIWLLWPRLPLVGAQPDLRIDMLSVHDGSCYIIRSGDSCIVYDCGSLTNLNAGETIIVPAMRRLGVYSVDALVLSHSNLDHISAALEVVDAFDVPQVFTTPQFLQEAEANPQQPPGFLISELNRRTVAIQTVSTGAQRSFGRCRWLWLHPDSDDEYDGANNSSSVILVETLHEPVPRRLLLTGDIEKTAVTNLLQRYSGSRSLLRNVDIMELPHHGSANDAAFDLFKRCQPSIVLQSTGWMRLQRDQWQPLLDKIEAQRLVTARDGACTVIVESDGAITTARHLPASGEEIEREMVASTPAE